jgi:hypothetical protein
MANPIRGEVELPVKQGDTEKPLILAFDINRMCELEAMFPGFTTTELVDRINTGNITVMRGFMWAGLRSYEMTLAQAGDVLQEIVPVVAGPLILDAMAKAFPKSKPPADPDGAPGGDKTSPT